MTKFLEDHPGGDEVLLSATGMKLATICLRVSFMNLANKLSTYMEVELH